MLDRHEDATRRSEMAAVCLMRPHANQVPPLRRLTELTDTGCVFRGNKELTALAEFDRPAEIQFKAIDVWMNVRWNDIVWRNDELLHLKLPLAVPEYGRHVFDVRHGILRWDQPKLRRFVQKPVCELLKFVDLPAPLPFICQRNTKKLAGSRPILRCGESGYESSPQTTRVPAVLRPSPRRHRKSFWPWRE